MSIFIIVHQRCIQCFTGFVSGNDRRAQFKSGNKNAPDKRVYLGIPQRSHDIRSRGDMLVFSDDSEPLLHRVIGLAITNT
ncbi:hypothetical protein [Pseudomonas fulva]|uniref:hypothetical protein n=1 Tax=Pseudomonas fulva TaxID=47880 RepID=UPI003CEA8EBA